jgi:hypothetical protein
MTDTLVWRNEAAPEPPPPLPPFVGMGSSGRSDRADELLDGFGRWPTGP